MAHDPHLAQRIRDLLVSTPGVTEKKMFGGIGFMVNGNMAVGAHSDGGMLVHCDKDAWPTLITEPGARAMERGGRGMAGWVLVGPDAVADADALRGWVLRARDHAAALPPK